jgi:hypothetical protein
MPRFIYLEHSSLTDETSWPAIERLLTIGDLQIVLSIWNLLEIALHEDTQVRERRLALIDRCRPHWVYDHVYIRRNEIRSYVWKHYFGVEPETFSAITPSLAGMNSYYAGRKSPLTL